MESEFLGNLLQGFFESIYTGIYSSCENLLGKIFDTLNYRVDWATDNLGQSLEEWNASAFNLVKGIADNAVIPIAGCVIIFVFCWEIIHLVQESNQMHNINQQIIIFTLVKFDLCLLACSKSFEIVMGIYSIGRYAILKLAGTTQGTFGIGISLSDVVPASYETYDFNVILEIAGILLVIVFCWLLCQVCAIIIYIQAISWFLEMLVYASVAAIPYATFLNKEWGQMGMNYTRKTLAFGFKGFFMILMFAIYGGVINNLAVTGNDFVEIMTMMCGCGVGLILLLFKAGNISDSIFNAH